MSYLRSFLAGSSFFAVALMAGTKVKMGDLPAGVQKSIEEQTSHATLVGISKETEKGKTMYEVETKVNGKSRDLMLDAEGKVLDVEEEVDLRSIPPGARAAIEKKAAGREITKVETVTHGSMVSYEAAIRIKSGKTTEVAVNGDGTPHK